MSVPLAPLIKTFIEYIAAVRAASPHTVRAYGRDLETFAAFLEEETGHPATLADFQLPLMRRFLVRRHDEVKASTIQRQIYALRSLGKFLHRRGILEQNPARMVRPPKGEKPIPHAPTADDMAILAASISPYTPAGSRDRAMLAVAYASGARAAELVALNLEDVDEKGVVRILFGKGSKQRLAIAGAAAMQALEDYLRRARPLFCHPRTGEQDPRALFLNRHGGRLTTRSVGRMVVAAGFRAGIKNRVRPHLLRHGCGGHMRDGGADLPYLQQLLGHSSMETTAGYLEVSADRLAAAHTRAHPFGRA